MSIASDILSDFRRMVDEFIARLTGSPPAAPELDHQTGKIALMPDQSKMRWDSRAGKKAPQVGTKAPTSVVIPFPGPIQAKGG
jgi:hypothetical protein